MGLQVLLVDDDAEVVNRLQPYVDPALGCEFGQSNLRFAKPVLQQGTWDMVIFNTRHGSSAILSALAVLTQLAQPPVVAFAGQTQELSQLEAYCLRACLPYIGYLNAIDNPYRLQRMVSQLGRFHQPAVFA